MTNEERQAKKLEKKLKWEKSQPAIIKKPLHLVYKVFGPKSVEGEVAKDAAEHGNGKRVNFLAREALNYNG